MSNDSIRENEMTVGLDVGDKHVHACFLDHDGIIVGESPIEACDRERHRKRG